MGFGLPIGLLGAEGIAALGLGILGGLSGLIGGNNR
jgi:hypothetical protein